MGRGRRVVVTGIGLICPTGIGTENAWKAILAGRSGIGPVTLFDATPFPCRTVSNIANTCWRASKSHMGTGPNFSDFPTYQALERNSRGRTLRREMLLRN
jgi:3-oxoacyl-(acyl-carrier-protein) synthase